MDASSQFQDSLPTTSDALLAQLRDWSIDFDLHHHVPLRTVEDAKAVEAGLLFPGQHALRLKNLYLRDRKKRNYLISLEQDRSVDLKALATQIGAAGLSFGSADRLLEVLGIRPGAVSPFALINAPREKMRFFIDAEAKEAEVIYMHPLVNDRTLAIPQAAFFSFLDKIGVTPEFL